VTILGILAALLFFGCVGTYMIAAGRLRAAQAQLKQKNEQVSDSERSKKMLSQAEAKYQMTLAELSNLEKSVSTRKYIPTLLAQLEDLARETHLRVISVRPESPPPPPPAAANSEPAAEGQNKESNGAKPAGTAAKKQEPPKPYDSQPIGIEVSGKYWNVVSFLYQLTTFPKILAVNSVDAEPATPGESGSPKLVVKMKVTAFIFHDADSSSPKPKPGQAAPGSGGSKMSGAEEEFQEAKI